MKTHTHRNTATRKEIFKAPKTQPCQRSKYFKLFCLGGVSIFYMAGVRGLHEEGVCMCVCLHERKPGFLFGLSYLMWVLSTLIMKCTPWHTDLAVPLKLISNNSCLLSLTSYFTFSVLNETTAVNKLAQWPELLFLCSVQDSESKIGDNKTLFFSLSLKVMSWVYSYRLREQHQYKTEIWKFCKGCGIHFNTLCANYLCAWLYVYLGMSLLCVMVPWLNSCHCWLSVCTNQMGNTGVNGTDTLTPDELVGRSIAHKETRIRTCTQIQLTSPSGM